MAKETAKRTFAILATSAAVCALVVATDISAAARGRGGGGGGHGGGGHGGGGHAAAHFGGGHGFGGHAFARHAFGGHAFAGHRFSSHAFAGHSRMNHAAGVAGTAAAIGAGGLAAHNLATHNNELGTHNNALTGGNRFAHAQLTHTQIAHNQFAAHNFRGLHNFNRHGFNRNAFGNHHAWNHWTNNFYGAGWNNWGDGWGGWAGPVFWPFLLGDALSFLFWPSGYYSPFWAYGPAFFLGSIFAPGPYFGPEHGYGPDYYAYRGGNAGSPNVYYGSAATAPPLSDADRQALADTNTQAVQSCGSLAPGVTDLPIADIQRTVRPTADQSAALNELNAAVATASSIVAASCPKDIPLTPVGRLDAAQKRLAATISAIDTVSAPLGNFYEALSDEQRQRFDAMGGSGRAGSPGSDLAQLCGQQGGSVANLPIQRIEEVVQPTEQRQQDAFNALKQASVDAANQLQAACPNQIPQSPVGRLDAVKSRLSAMLEAMKTVRPKLQQFYASLSDEQKARFDTMGPPLNASAQAQRGGGQ
jgi:LTXXQ motif family protein